MENSLDDDLATATAPTRRCLIGAAGWSLAASALLGVALGAQTDDVIAPNSAYADEASRARPKPPSFPAVTEADAGEWAMFRRRFISAEGRVIDTGNNCITHTEGQGWGMLFAVTFDDRATFDRLLGWTRANLARIDDSLLRWCYDPSRADPVEDPNNATDGDIFIAWALWKAAFRWNNSRYADQARAIARDILRLLVVPAGARILMLPGATGFENADAINVNLSYYCFPALRDLAQAVPSPKWAALETSGLALIETGRFGRWMLPPDWLSVSRHDGSLAPAAGWPARFSYDAIRIPLYLAWSRQMSPAVGSAFDNYWAQGESTIPAWVDLRSGLVAGYGCSPGVMAVAKLASSPENKRNAAPFPSIHASPDYYSASLILLSRIAAYDSLV